MTAGDPVLYLQLADSAGIVAQYRAGGQAELDLIDACTAAIVARGVGLIRTERHVAQDIRDGIAEVIARLKKTANFTTAMNGE